MHHISNRWIIYSIFTFATTTLLFFFNRGFIHHDEGYFLHAAQRILDGELLYQDFHHLYPPGTAVVTALTFNLLGESIISGRILMLGVSVIGALVFFRLGQESFGKNSYLSLIPPLIYIAWGPTHINFPWPVMFELVLGGLTYLALFLAIKRKALGLFFLSGFLTGMTLIFKQNFGLAAFLNTTLIFLLLKPARQINYIGATVAGFVAASSTLFLYLYANSSLHSFLYDTVLFVFDSIILRGQLNSPLIPEANIYLRIAKVIFYLLPLLISATALGICWRSKTNRRYFYLLSFPLLFYLVGIRPTTDYNHLTPLIALTGFPLAFIVKELKVLKNFQFAAAFLSLLLIVFGFHTALFKGYYRWETPLFKQNRFIDKEKIRILTDEKYSTIISSILPYIDKHTKENDFIYMYPQASMFYFITSRRNPTPFLDQILTHLFPQGNDSVVDKLKQKKVELILTHVPLDNHDDILFNRYVEAYFRPVVRSYEFVLWERVDRQKTHQLMKVT